MRLALGFTVGLDMPFSRATEWAAAEGFDFVEILLDGAYARERIEDDAGRMADQLDAHGLGVVVHLPFNADPGSPFAPVREGVVREFTAGMDLARDLGAEKVVFHPSSDAWDLGWTEEAAREFTHDALDTLVPAARDRGLTACLENIVSSYYDATTFPELLERYPESSMTFDTSHAHLAGLSAEEMVAFVEEYGDRIDHLHFVDTRSGDEHLPVGMGRLDFEAILGADWAGTATLEVGTEDYDTIALGKRHVEALADRATF